MNMTQALGAGGGSGGAGGGSGGENANEDKGAMPKRAKKNGIRGCSFEGTGSGFGVQ